MTHLEVKDVHDFFVYAQEVMTDGDILICDKQNEEYTIADGKNAPVVKYSKGECAPC